MPTALRHTDVAEEWFDLWKAIRRATADAFNQHGLSLPRAKVLWALESHGPLRARVLAEHLDCTGATVTELVDALSGDGLVTRTPDPQDRRAVLIEITSAGRKLGRQSLARRVRVFDEIFSNLDSDQIAQLKALHDQIAASPILQGAHL